MNSRNYVLSPSVQQNPACLLHNQTQGAPALILMWSDAHFHHFLCVRASHVTFCSRFVNIIGNELHVRLIFSNGDVLRLCSAFWLGFHILNPQLLPRSLDVHFA